MNQTQAQAPWRTMSRDLTNVGSGAQMTTIRLSGCRICGD
jgi:hypothetical protein